MHRARVAAVLMGTVIGDRIVGTGPDPLRRLPVTHFGSQREWEQIEAFLGPEWITLAELQKISGARRTRVQNGLAFGKMTGRVEQTARNVRIKGRGSALRSVYRRLEHVA
jgi:hypothetical protein